jgi:phosphotriesterase-related protein
LFIRDIREGIAGSDIKAGILKGVSDISGVKPIEENILRGVARAHLPTAVPIMLHSYSPGQVGKQQIAILREEGVDLRRVKLDHSNDTTDIEYLTWLLEQGCYLGLDRYPGGTLSPSIRTKTMKILIDTGCAHRLLPSHDHTFVRVMAEFPAISPEERKNGIPMENST